MKPKTIIEVEVFDNNEYKWTRMGIEDYRALKETERKKYSISTIVTESEEFSITNGGIHYNAKIKKEDENKGDIAFVIKEGKIIFVDLDGDTKYTAGETAKVWTEDTEYSKINAIEYVDLLDIKEIGQKMQGWLTPEIQETLDFLRGISPEISSIDELMERIEEYGKPVVYTIDEAMKETVESVILDPWREMPIDEYYNKEPNRRISHFTTNKGTYFFNEKVIEFSGENDGIFCGFRINNGKIQNFEIAKDGKFDVLYDTVPNNAEEEEEEKQNVDSLEELINIAIAKGVPGEFISNRILRAELLALLCQNSKLTVRPQDLFDLLESGRVFTTEEQRAAFVGAVTAGQNIIREKENQLKEIEKTIYELMKRKNQLKKDIECQKNKIEPKKNNKDGHGDR